MNKAALDVNRIADFQQDQARQSKSDLDTKRLDWCEANLNSAGWSGARVVIHDHAGTPTNAASFRRAIDVAMENVPPVLGGLVRIDKGIDAATSPGLDMTALRYQALIDLVTGKDAQQFLTDMCWDGSAPTRKQLEAKLDKMIEAAR
jgi:hypothetical protein